MMNWKLLIVSLLILLSIPGCGYLNRWTHEAKETAYQEVRPQMLLKKYRYFKQVAAELDSKQANIATMGATLKTWEKRFAKLPAERWPLRIQEQYDQRLTEINALKANFNGLAADYNRAMADLSWSFCNAGPPPGGIPDSEWKPLPRKFRTYIIE